MVVQFNFGKLLLMYSRSRNRIDQQTFDNHFSDPLPRPLDILLSRSLLNDGHRNFLSTVKYKT